jgi:hypothetical protein
MATCLHGQTQLSATHSTVIIFKQQDESSSLASGAREHETFSVRNWHTLDDTVLPFLSNFGHCVYTEPRTLFLWTSLTASTHACIWASGGSAGDSYMRKIIVAQLDLIGLQTGPACFLVSYCCFPVVGLWYRDTITF